MYLSFIFLIFSLLFTTPLERKIDAYLKEQHFQGAVLLAKDGKVFFKKGYGYANLDYLIPNTPKTLFRIGSLTKQFTAVTILQLQEKGLLNVQDPINKYILDYPQGEKITIHHLLSHTSGIPSITRFSNLAEIQRHPTTALKTIEHFKNLPLEFEPGTDCDYSDSNYIILGAIIEIVSQQPYEKVLEAHIFQPLAMEARYDLQNAIIPNRASGYEKNLTNSSYLDMSFPHGAGSLISSVEDIYKFYQGLPKILSIESRLALFSIHGLSEKNKISYGYGFTLGPLNPDFEGCDELVLGHFGSIEGFVAATVFYPKDDIQIVLLSNVEQTNVLLFHKEIYQLFHSSWRP